MPDTHNISSFYSSLGEIPLNELILLYFLGYVIASIVRNVYGSEISTSFNFTKKFASGLILFYFVLKIPSWALYSLSISGESSAFDATTKLAALLVLAMLFLHQILHWRLFVKFYIKAYAVFMLLSVKYIGGYKVETVFVDLVRKHDNFNFLKDKTSRKYYSKHVISHIPEWLITFILVYNSSSLISFLFLLTVSFVFLTTNYFSEFVEQGSSNPWMHTNKGFGGYIRRLAFVAGFRLH